MRVCRRWVAWSMATSRCLSFFDLRPRSSLPQAPPRHAFRDRGAPPAARRGALVWGSGWAGAGCQPATLGSARFAFLRRETPQRSLAGMTHAQIGKTSLLRCANRRKGGRGSKDASIRCGGLLVGLDLWPARIRTHTTYTLRASSLWSLERSPTLQDLFGASFLMGRSWWSRSPSWCNAIPCRLRPTPRQNASCRGS